MYIDAVCKGIDEIPTVDDDTRQMMMQKYKEEGLESLCSQLKLLDPAHYEKVDLKNPKRVIHALEICYMTGKPYSSFLTNEAKERPFRIIKIGLRRDREELFQRISKRVDEMMRDGLLEEVKHLYPFRKENSLNTVGYKELFQYLDVCKKTNDLVQARRVHSLVPSRPTTGNNPSHRSGKRIRLHSLILSTNPISFFKGSEFFCRIKADIGLFKKSVLFLLKTKD